MKYLFGDTDLAARRLTLLARVYKPSTESFLREACPSSRPAPPQLAIDLGCGPGHTTKLLAETSQARHTIGLDNSPAFVAEANATAAPNVTFYRHNFCRTPLPAAPADLIFARYLLAHLRDPAFLVASWIRQLAPGGRLLLDEVEAIETDIDVFARYLAIVDRMLIASGSNLYIGKTLPALGSPNSAPLARIAYNDLRRIPVSNADAATMFSMNISSWAANAFIRANYERGEILALEGELLRIADGHHESSASPSGSITWHQRQIAFERI